MAQITTLAHQVEILDDHMCDFNWKKLLDMIPSLCQKYLTAIEMSEAAVHYFAEQSMKISAELIPSWEAEITIAESLRDQDKKAMDILKAQIIGLQARHGGNLADTGLESGSQMPDTDTFWIQLALDIEEWQIALEDHVHQMSWQAWKDE
ncbi:hypothetical protein J132_04167 [Termitomyces sp. J132]|nr:hypothetical protein J132_04167 [Termitomyces sp. J132]